MLMHRLIRYLKIFHKFKKIMLPNFNQFLGRIHHALNDEYSINSTLRHIKFKIGVGS